MSTRTAWQQSLDTLLAAIKEDLDNGRDVILLAGGTKLSHDKWRKDGKPNTVELVESKIVDGYYYRVFMETSYGRIILVRGADTMCRVAHGQYMAELGGVVALDKEYHGVHKYLWE